MTMHPYSNVLLAIMPTVADEDATRMYDGRFSAREIEQFHSAVLIDLIDLLHRTQKCRFVIHTTITGYDEILTPHLLTNIELHADLPPKEKHPLVPVLEKMRQKKDWKSVVVLAGFHPLVTPDHIHASFELLDIADDAVVYGATGDGSLYLCGMRNDHLASNGPGFPALTDDGTFLRSVCASDSLILPLDTLPPCSTAGDLHAVRESIELMIENKQEYPKKTMDFLRHTERRLHQRRNDE